MGCPFTYSPASFLDKPFFLMSPLAMARNQAACFLLRGGNFALQYKLDSELLQDLHESRRGGVHCFL